MEDRLAEPRTGWPGGALTALAAILVITAAWWALALWPAGANAPEWLTRTRTACFGSAPGGLPDAGGWILLLGEPIGMIGALLVVWGRALGRDLRWVASRPGWRIAAIVIAGVMLAATAVLAVRVDRAWRANRVTYATNDGLLHRVDRDLPPLRLVDQLGQPFSLTDLRGPTTLVTFAFGHCTTVCPVIVHDLQAARRLADRPEVPIIVITLDPWRDTPDRLPALMGHWELAPQDRVLSGSVSDVEQALDSLGVARRRSLTTGDVDHVTAVLILDAAGRIAWRVDGGSRGVAETLAGTPLAAAVPSAP